MKECRPRGASIYTQCRVTFLRRRLKGGALETREDHVGMLEGTAFVKNSPRLADNIGTPNSRHSGIPLYCFNAGISVKIIRWMIGEQCVFESRRRGSHPTGSGASGKTFMPAPARQSIRILSFIYFVPSVLRTACSGWSHSSSFRILLPHWGSQIRCVAVSHAPPYGFSRYLSFLFQVVVYHAL